MKNIYLFLLSVVILCSCNDFLDREPKTNLSPGSFWKSEEDLRLAANVFYQNMNRSYTLDNQSADGFANVGNLVSSGTHAPGNTDGIWTTAYKQIRHANNFLENYEKAEVSEATKNRYAGEARFFRAYHYHLLVNFFGNIPLLTEPQSITDKPTQTDRNQVSDFILNELEEATKLLPVQHTGDDIGRVTQGCALSIKAREALFSEKWDIAAEASKRIIESGVYSLEPNYNNLFNKQNKQSKEAIFFVQYSRVNQQTHGVPGNLFSRMASGYSNKVPAQSLVDSYYCTDGLPINESSLYNAAAPFKNRDLRLEATIVVPGSTFQGYQFETHPDSLECWDYNVTPAVRRNNQDVTNPYATFSGYCWRKYTDEEQTFRLKSELNIILIRYAEVLLMYAEAVNELGRMDDLGYEALKLVRERAQMPAIKSDTQENIRKLIRQERKVEFAMEGLRFFDIRRWKIAESVMNGKLYGRPVRDYQPNYIPTFDQNGMPQYDAYAGALRSFDNRTFNPDRDYLFPIPQKELDINKNLKQNPNY